MNRRQFLGAAAACGGLASCLSVPPPTPDGPPNVILLMADDLGWGDVGFNGNRIVAANSSTVDEIRLAENIRPPGRNTHLQRSLFCILRREPQLAQDTHLLRTRDLHAYK